MSALTSQSQHTDRVDYDRVAACHDVSSSVCEGSDGADFSREEDDTFDSPTSSPASVREDSSVRLISPAHGCSDAVEGKDDVDSDTQVEAPGLFGRGGLMEVRNVPVLLLATVLLEVNLSGFGEIFSLWALSTRVAGGLEMDSLQIGKVLFVVGIGLVVYQVGAYSWFIKWAGLVTFHRGAGIVHSVLYLVVPLLGYLPLDNLALSIICSIVVALTICSLYSMNTAVMVAATNPVPPHMRGKLAGLMTSGQALGGSLGPAILTVVFAWSISKTSSASRIPWMNQHFVFSILALNAVVLVIVTWNVLTVEALTKVVDDTSSPRTTKDESDGTVDGYDSDSTRDERPTGIDDQTSDLA